MMKYVCYPFISAPILFAQERRGGKSLARDMYSKMFRGICLEITPFLLLGIEHSSKVTTKPTHDYKEVLSMCLCGIHSTIDKKLLIQSMLELPKDAKKTIMLHSSLQIIVSEEEWKYISKR